MEFYGKIFKCLIHEIYLISIFITHGLFLWKTAASIKQNHAKILRLLTSWRWSKSSTAVKARRQTITIPSKTNPSNIIMHINSFPLPRNNSLSIKNKNKIKLRRTKPSAYAKLKVENKLSMIRVLPERICLKFIARRWKRRNGIRLRLSLNSILKTVRWQILSLTNLVELPIPEKKFILILVKSLFLLLGATKTNWSVPDISSTKLNRQAPWTLTIILINLYFLRLRKTLMLMKISKTSLSLNSRPWKPADQDQEKLLGKQLVKIETNTISVKILWKRRERKLRENPLWR